MKECRCCNEVKLLCDFNNDSNTKDGKDSVCRVCRKEKQREYRLKTKHLKRESDRRYREKHREELKQKKSEYYQQNRHLISEIKAQKYKENPENTKVRSKKWKEQNRAKHNHNCMLRHTGKLNATPKWLDELMMLVIEEFYDKAIKLEKLTGVKYNVDHIVPLRNKVVCGLHVPWNLQLLPARDNFSKNNKLPSEDMLILNCGWSF